MALPTFPSNPTNLQVYSYAGRDYYFFSDTGTWIATRGAWETVAGQLNTGNVGGTTAFTLSNGVGYVPVSTPYVVTNRVFLGFTTDYPPEPIPTITLTGTTNNLSESSTRSFILTMTNDIDNIAQLSIVGGGGTLSSTSVAAGGSFVYTPANVAVNTTVTIRGTAETLRGLQATSDIVFTVTDTPNPTVAITGSTADIAYGGDRLFTVSSTNDVDGLIAISITSGGGTLSSTSVGTGSSFIYTPGTYSGSVTISATAVNYDNETATSSRTVNALPNVVTASGGSTINGQTALQQIRTSDYITSGGTFEIPSNYWIWSDNTGVAALIVDTPNATVVNYGKIIGKGGRGGGGGGAGGHGAGAAGGPAIQVTASGVTITNISGAYIAGGGGGGGGGNSGPANSGGGGGAGGGDGGTRSGQQIFAAGGAINSAGAGIGGNSGGGGGAGGGGGWADYQKENASFGGAGGRILPGVGGTSNNNLVNGGSAGNPGTGQGNSAFRSWGGGGGGWGAAGASCSGGYPGGAGGAAVSGSYTRGTWSGTVYGSA